MHVAKIKREMSAGIKKPRVQTYTLEEKICARRNYCEEK